MCNCRNTYPLSVQLRMAAMDFACKTAGHAEPTDSTVTAAKRFETFLLGDYTSKQLDEQAKDANSFDTPAKRADIVTSLFKSGMSFDVEQQDVITRWINGPLS